MTPIHRLLDQVGPLRLLTWSARAEPRIPRQLKFVSVPEKTFNFQKYIGALRLSKSVVEIYGNFKENYQCQLYIDNIKL